MSLRDDAVQCLVMGVWSCLQRSKCDKRFATLPDETVQAFTDELEKYFPEFLKNHERRFLEELAKHHI